VGKTIAVAVGLELRRIRTSRGLTLRDVGIISDWVFTPTAVAGYERGERNISVRRFCELARFYGVEPVDLLAEALHTEDRTSVVNLKPYQEPVQTASAR
jgi:transcriptional regulator with XRE-family HTH domain